MVKLTQSGHPIYIKRRDIIAVLKNITTPLLKNRTTPLLTTLKLTGWECLNVDQTTDEVRKAMRWWRCL